MNVVSVVNKIRPYKKVNIYRQELKEKNRNQKGLILIKSSVNWLVNKNLLTYFKLLKYKTKT
jgi:hypothetical protein